MTTIVTRVANFPFLVPEFSKGSVGMLTSFLQRRHFGPARQLGSGVDEAQMELDMDPGSCPGRVVH
ncbi:hypothetical protein [Novosphingobium sp. BL-52-GroH]|uniref:hypothetical protein n=1 Tax=Novosphingobium sp. BL-52-GroH TaxID=3349877 RepID=UPI00384D07DE